MSRCTGRIETLLRWLYGLTGFPAAIRPEEAIRFAFTGHVAGAIYLDDVALTR